MANFPLILPCSDLTSTKNDQDVFSSLTETSGTSVASTTSELTEYVVRFAYRCRHYAPDATSTFANGHRSILSLLHQLFPGSLMIFDNNNNKFRFPDSHCHVNSYQFTITHIPPNRHQQRGSMYMIHHRVYSSIPISVIQSHPTVHKALHQLHIRLHRHHWREDEARISNIGFLVGVDPHNHLPNETVESIRVGIISKLKCTQQSIPYFKLVQSTPYFIDHTGNRTRTRSYDVQVRHNDVKRLIVLFEQMYSDNNGFIFHNIRHKDPQLYLSAICHQEEFLKNCRFVPLHGVSASSMVSFKSHVEQIPGVQAVLPHKHTSTQGRWSVMTDKLHFSSVTTILKQILLIHHPSNADLEYSNDGPIFLSPVSIGLSLETKLSDNIDNSEYSPYRSSALLLKQENEKLKQELSVLKKLVHAIHDKKSTQPHPIELQQVLSIVPLVLHQLFSYAVLNT